MLAVYAVTCSHVAKKNPVIRLNTCEGDIGVLDYRGKWEHHANDDIAAVHIGALDRDQFKFKLLGLQHFINQEIIYRFDIGPGDEVFMVGRFITGHNQQRNAPAVRFGNISMIYAEPVFNAETKKEQEGMAVEMRSIPGYSGSPVFVYTPFDEHHHQWSERRKITTWGTRQRQVSLSQIMSGGPWLLGLGWGYQTLTDNVLKSDGKTLVNQRYVVQSNSGMMYVVPAWKIQELLNCKKFLDKREEKDQIISEYHARGTTKTTP